MFRRSFFSVMGTAGYIFLPWPIWSASARASYLSATGSTWPTRPAWWVPISARRHRTHAGGRRPQIGTHHAGRVGHVVIRNRKYVAHKAGLLGAYRGTTAAR